MIHKPFFISLFFSLFVFVSLLVIQFMLYEGVTGAASVFYFDAARSASDFQIISVGEFIQQNEFPYLLAEDGTITLNTNP